MKIFQKLLFFSIFLLILSSCSKETQTSISEDVDSSQNEFDPTNPPSFDVESREGEVFDYTRCRSILGRITKNGNMLAFDDLLHFEECAVCLEQEYQDYNDQYESQYPNATAEELMMYDSLNNFDEWTPFIDFEQTHRFSSLREKVESEILSWLANAGEDLDMSINPEDRIPIMEESVRTLLNANGEAYINREVVTMDELEGSGIEDRSDDCAWNDPTTRYFYGSSNVFPASALGNNRRLRMKIKVVSGLVRSKLTGKITFYKPRNIFNGWKRERATMRVGVSGTAFNNSCELGVLSQWFKSKGYKKRKSRKVVDRIWGRWREALVDDTNPDWPVDGSIVHGFFRNDNNYFPVRLVR